MRSADGNLLTLYTGKGYCVGEALHALHMTSAGKITPGCWVGDDEGEYVLVSYLDGQRGNVPLQLFKRAVNF